MFIIDEDAIQSPLTALHDAGYQIGSLGVVAFDPAREDLFPPPFLYSLYEATRQSGRSHLGSLPSLFCGMSNLTPDAICAYLLQQRVIVMGEWRANPTPVDPEDPLPVDFEELIAPKFHPLGYLFPSSYTRSSDTLANSMFAGYCFFQEAWRTRQQLVLTYLGLAYLFCEFRLVSLHGIRYHDNKLTARWMEQFGFRDVGTIPNYMSERGGGELVPATISTLPRAEFEEQLRQVFRELMADSDSAE